MMACEHCNGWADARCSYIGGENLSAYISHMGNPKAPHLVLAQTGLHKGFSGFTKFVIPINNCPMCGEKLGDDHE